MLPILARASAGSPILSLQLSFPLSEVRSSTPQDCLSILRSIGFFASLRSLKVPSRLLHRNALSLFAALPSLQVLQLTSDIVRYSEWHDMPELERDDWSQMDLDVQGFASLKHLYFDGTPPDQILALAGIASLLPAVQTMTLRGDILRGDPEIAQQYIPVFTAIERICTMDHTVNLGLAVLDEQLLRLLAALNLTAVGLFPVESSFYDRIEHLLLTMWPQVKIKFKGYDDN
ncbi:hypothetical protein BDV93DRAFT_564253 [Ceratobasidium sp. AG-I]|nr:hypothetical protein BDV93DRAFT_564253 [Ceratobasidium sp. AG-I]